MRSSTTMMALHRRLNIPLTASSPPGLVQADTVDPFRKADKYARAWTYFGLVLVVLIAVVRAYHKWTDKLRQAMHKNEVERFQQAQLDRFNEQPDWSMVPTATATSDRVFFPDDRDEEQIAGLVLTRGQSHWSSIAGVNDTIALFRWLFYRPIPDVRWRKRSLLSFPSLSVVAILVVALAFVALYCFLPQPLYWQSIRYGSPPLAVRAGMLAVAMTPWIIATSMKANLITWITGIGHDRLGVFHRWGGYLCLFLTLVHTVPFYIQPVWEDNGLSVFGKMFPPGSGIVYGSGIACLVPIGWLCIGSLPFIRSLAYELFVVLHVPVAFVYVGMLFWHTHNYLTSWAYLWATVGIWVVCYSARLLNLNWTNPWRRSWLIGDEAAVTIMSENAVKVTVATQMRWRPGQYVYLRMPGISFFENHPFTISSLCSEDFVSDYGEGYRDLTMVFRPFGGFTRKVLETAIEKGPFHTYRAYLDGPYGGMQRELAAFETVILFAGGSGITAIVSQLLNLIKRMRDGKAVTKKIEVVWALRNLEAMDWFKEELRICRDHAPPGTVTCQFFVTKAKRSNRKPMTERAPRPISNMLHDKLDGFVAGIAEKRNSALIRDEAKGNPEIEKRLREEDQDAITSLPRQKHLQPRMIPPLVQTSFPPPPTEASSNRWEALRALEGRKTVLSSVLAIDKHEMTRRFLEPLRGTPQEDPQEEGYFPSPPQPIYDRETFRGESKSSSPRLKDFDINDVSSYPPPPPGGPPASRPSPLVAQRRGSIEKPRLSPELKLDIPGALDPPRMPFPSDEQNHSPGWPFPKDHKHPEPSSVPPAVPISHRATPSQMAQHRPPPSPSPTTPHPPGDFEFGFPSTPTEFQKNLMRFAFLSSNKRVAGGWTTEYGRPDLGFMLKEMATGGLDGRGIFGRRTCVFVCGPPGMRESVARATAALQGEIWGDDQRDEVVLYTENYAI